jgi:uncharacterized membrane protein (UPF0127 family)
LRFALVFALTLATALTVFACGDDDAGPVGSYTEEVRFTRAGHEVSLFVEVADSGAERQRGLMGRSSLPDDAGMLFVYSADTETGFFMRDTTVPLSIAFVTAGGSVIDIQNMEPLSEEPHFSPQPFRYAVEANQGWFGDNDVKVGDLVQLPVGIGLE